MSYVRYKEVTKHFNFLRVISKDNLPLYIKHYVKDDEIILSTYETSRDHGIFTDKKIILFDNVSVFGKYKQIFTIPYKSISYISVLFAEKSAILNMSLECAFPLKLKFVNMSAVDKVRLRVLYTCIDRIINGQEPLREDVDRLINDSFDFSK